MVSPGCLGDYFRSNPSLVGSWGGFSPAPGRGCSTWASPRGRESRKGSEGEHREEGTWEHQKLNCKPDVASEKEKSSVWIERSLWQSFGKPSRGNALEQQDFSAHRGNPTWIPCRISSIWSCVIWCVSKDNQILSSNKIFTTQAMDCVCSEKSRRAAMIPVLRAVSY